MSSSSNTSMDDIKWSTADDRSSLSHSHSSSLSTFSDALKPDFGNQTICCLKSPPALHTPNTDSSCSEMVSREEDADDNVDAKKTGGNVTRALPHALSVGDIVAYEYITNAGEWQWAIGSVDNLHHSRIVAINAWRSLADDENQ